MANIIKTTPNQKVVVVNKEKCGNGHLYAAINLEAMEDAARALDAGAFKLWCYFAKNQNGFEFALSSKAVGESFGIKIKQYNNAVDELISKGYLVNTKGNNYEFREIPVITKEDNAVITKKDNEVITKEDNELLPLVLRNNTNITFNNTKDNTEKINSVGGSKGAVARGQGTIADPYIVSREWLIERRNELVTLSNGIFQYNTKFFKMGVAQ